MADVADILMRLAKVKKTGPDSWHASCPSHADKSPSLTIKEVSDGRILMHCFGGCETDSVLGAIGLEFADLFPEKLGEFTRIPNAFTTMDALRALETEAALIAIVAGDIADGKPISAQDADRAALAAGRIKYAREFVYGGN